MWNIYCFHIYCLTGVPDSFTIPDLPPFPTTSPDRKSLQNPEGISPPIVENDINPLGPGGVDPLNTTRSESDPTLVTSTYHGKNYGKVAGKKLDLFSWQNFMHCSLFFYFYMSVE